METGSAQAGLCNGLSRMKGNFHVRFLGEGVAAMPLPYPTWQELIVPPGQSRVGTSSAGLVSLCQTANMFGTIIPTRPVAAFHPRFGSGFDGLGVYF